MRVGKFYKGAEFAGVVILDIADGETWNREALYRVRCKECGAITEIRGSSLQNRMERGVTGCSVCRNQHAKKGTFLQRNSRVCDDCQALRPADGTPCVCGGTRLHRVAA